MQKMLLKIKMSLLFLFLIFAFNAYGEVPTHLPSNIPPKETSPSKITPVSPLIQKASDLSIEKVYLKDCRIYVVLKNMGSGGVTDEDYQSGELMVLVKKGERDFEKNPFKLKDVDPKFILKTPGQVVEFDTKISLQESQLVRVQLEKFKNDGKTGRKYLVPELKVTSICKSLGEKHEIKASQASKIDITTDKLKKIQSQSTDRVGVKSNIPNVIAILEVVKPYNDLYIDIPFSVSWIAVGEDFKIGQTPIKVYLINEKNRNLRWTLYTTTYTIRSSDFRDQVQLKISTGQKWDWERKGSPPIRENYELQVCADLAEKGELCSEPRSMGKLLNWIEFDPFHPPPSSITSWPAQFFFKVHDLQEVKSRQWSWCLTVDDPVIPYYALTYRGFGGQYLIDILWPCYVIREKTGELNKYDGIRAVLKFRFHDGIDYVNTLDSGEVNSILTSIITSISATNCDEAFNALKQLLGENWIHCGLTIKKEEKVYTEAEGWATVSKSDLSVENITTHGGDIEIMVKNRGPETLRSRVIPLKVIISDRFATRVYHKEYSLTSSVSSVPVNGILSISLGKDLGICLQDQSFTVGVELKPQGYWRDNNSSNNVMGKHFNLTFDPRPNLYFSGTEKIRVTRRGDEVKVRTTIGYDGLPWCLSPHKVALRVLKQGGTIIYERETQATQGPVEFTLSASEIKRLGGGKRSIIEVFLDWDHTINENNEIDNHEYTYYDF